MGRLYLIPHFPRLNMILDISKYISKITISKFGEIRLMILKNHGFNQKYISIDGIAQINTFEADISKFTDEYEFLCHIEAISLVTDEGLDLPDYFLDKKIYLNRISIERFQSKISETIASFYGASLVDSWNSEITLNGIQIGYEINAGWYGLYLLGRSDKIYFVFQYVPID